MDAREQKIHKSHAYELRMHKIDVYELRMHKIDAYEQEIQAKVKRNELMDA